MRINLERLRQNLESLARVGATPGGGVARVTLSDADKEGRDRVVQWMKEAGLAVSVDSMGNIFGRREGNDPGADPVWLGSHTDSVWEGGMFDGPLGVLGPLEIVRTLNEHDRRTRRAIEVVDFTNEEGNRYQPPMLGSLVLSGGVSQEWAYDRVDREGKRLGDELERIGYRGAAPCAKRPVHAYLELHIEQGPVLEAEGLSIGVVEGIQGLTWIHVTLEGEADHAGTTPREMRHDPLVVASRVVCELRRLMDESKGNFLGTVGSLDVVPNGVNIIPARVRLVLDMRSMHEQRRRDAEARMRSLIAEACAGEGVRHEISKSQDMAACRFSVEVLDLLERKCRELGHSYKRMFSGAGHDAKHMNDITRTAMIFVPSIGGKSHSPLERTSWEDVERGVNLMLEAALELAS